MTAIPVPDGPAFPAVVRLRRELRAVGVVVRREVLHFVRDRAQSLVVLLQPLLFLFVLGAGLSRLLDGLGGTSGADHAYLVFLFPGVLVMAVQAPAISVGASIVWDRENGFLREMLVAPVRRSTLLVGKCLGGALVAAAQAVVVLAFAGAIGIPYRPLLLVELLPMLVLTAFAMTALGGVVAVWTRRVGTFTTLLSMLMTPLIFTSGLMFPVSAMPSWLLPVTLANPLTYAVDALRRMVNGAVAPAPSPLTAVVTWGSLPLPLVAEIGLVVVFTVLALGAGARRFARVD